MRVVHPPPPIKLNNIIDKGVPFVRPRADRDSLVEDLALFTALSVMRAQKK